jgi:transporter family-2 protein
MESTLGKDEAANVLIAMSAGIILAIMTDWNSLLARYSSPLFASWTAHGIGTLSSLTLVGMISARPGAKQKPVRAEGRWPLWSYLGGIPGALIVLLAALTVNSPLGLAGTLALMLMGQILFGIAADTLGLFALARKTFKRRDLLAIGLIVAGSLAIILARS